MSIRIPLIALAVSFAAPAFAQDSLFYTNGSVIVGQVTEIGLDVVKYRTNSDGHAVLIEVDKHDLAKVKLKDGQAYYFASTELDEGLYNTAFTGRKHVLSLDVVAPALNHVTIGYEQVIGPRISLIVKAGYIGLLHNEDRYDDNVYGNTGGLLTAGVKFILPRSAKRMRPSSDAHPLAGWYFSPELMFSAWTSRSDYAIHNEPYFQVIGTETTHDYTSAALGLSIGRELFLGEHFTFDISGGFGYGMEWQDGHSNNSNNQHYTSRQQYAFSHVFTDPTSPFVLTGGMRFGYVF